MADAHYRESGFVIERAVLTATAIERGREEADRLFEDAQVTDPAHVRTRSRGSLSGQTVIDRLDFVGDVSPVFIDLANDPAIVDLAARYLGEAPRIFKEKLVTKPSGTAGYGLHQDYMRWQDFPPSADEMVSVAVSFDHATEQNGALQVCAGQHGRLLTAPGVVADPEPDDIDEARTVLVELRPGDAVVLHPLLPHRSDFNRSEGPRRMLFCTYAAARFGDLRSVYYEHHAEMFGGTGSVTTP